MSSIITPHIDNYASYTCKARHSRCDEKKPVCGNCERLNLECKPSEFIAPSTWNKSAEPTTQAQSSNDPSPLSSEAPGSTWDIFKAFASVDFASDETPPDNVFLYLNLDPPTLPAPTSPPSTALAVSLTPETAFLLQTYLRTVATWMDLMDHASTYQLSIPRLTLTSPLLFHCICAVTAKHLALANSRHNSSWDPVAREHYGQSLRLLIDELNTPSHGHALTATIILSGYEIIASIFSEHHRRHFLGLTMLIKNHNITAQSTGIDRANFWIYVRHEIGFALANEKPLMLNPEEWAVRLEYGETREDVLGNHVLWILARVINLVYGEEGTTVAVKRHREAFLRELEEWRAGLSDTFVGIPYGEADEEGFRKVYFTVTAAGRSPLSHLSQPILSSFARSADLFRFSSFQNMS